MIRDDGSSRFSLPEVLNGEAQPVRSAVPYCNYGFDAGFTMETDD
jgi:hypothetical protein